MLLVTCFHLDFRVSSHIPQHRAQMIMSKTNTQYELHVDTSRTDRCWETTHNTFENPAVQEQVIETVIILEIPLASQVDDSFLSRREVC